MVKIDTFLKKKLKIGFYEENKPVNWFHRYYGAQFLSQSIQSVFNSIIHFVPNGCIHQKYISIGNYDIFAIKEKAIEKSISK